jgi:nucleoside-diphosphate-sugar epimerase
MSDTAAQARLEAVPTAGTVAVTGAGGFVGARLVELLRRDPHVAGVRPLARRRRAGATRLRLDRAGEVAQALRGCQAVVHCAFDFEDASINLDIAATLASACAAGGIRLVQLSTWSVYRTIGGGELDETCPSDHGGGTYQETKLSIEELLLRSVQELGLDVVILQPTLIYGPAGGAWTDAPVRELLNHRVLLPDGGMGLCNAVYVDDVCQAVVRALTAAIPSGEKFLISGPAPVPWKDFLGSYERILGLRSLEFLPPDRPPQEKNDAAHASGVTRGQRALLRAAKSWAVRRIGVQSWGAVSTRLRSMPRLVRGRTRLLPSGAKLALYRSTCQVSSAKARRLLDYRPAYGLSEGMDATATYLRQNYLG